MIPRTIGRFEVLREIGRGAMGQVFLAHDPKIDRQVAIKTIAQSPGLPEAEAQENSRRFQREAQAAGRLLHPNIVTIFDVGEEGGVAFIAMEYIDGVTLDRHARPDGLLPPGRVLDLMVQAAAALDYAHQARVIHRDIKPANLMMLADGTLKVTDFGLAKSPEAHLTQSGVLLGTPSYMSPEQIQGKPLDGRSDLFSLGVALYELLCGVRPFDAESISTIIYRVLYEDPRPPAAHNPALPAEVNLVIEKALAKDPDRRYATGAALVSDLRKAFASLPPSTLSRPFPAGAAAFARKAEEATARRGRAPAGRVAASDASGGRAGRRGAGQGAAAAGVEGAPTLIAHHPVKIAAVVMTLAAALLVFPRLANRSERSRHRLAAAPAAAPVEAGAAAADGPVAAAGIGTQPGGSGGRVSVAIETRPAGGRIDLDSMTLAEPRVVLETGDARAHVLSARSGCLEARSEIRAGDLAGRSAPLILDLKPRRETLSIASDPAGAAIRLDGGSTGLTTPAALDIDTCQERTIELQAPGYQTWRRVLPAGGDLGAARDDLAKVALQPVPKGTVTVPRPRTYAVDVYAGEVRLGRAGEPIALTEGTHRLTLRNDELFVRETVQVTVAGGRDTRPTVTLPEVGRLTVQAQPSNCKVYLDGVYVDVTPVLERPIAAGPHRVKVVFVPNGTVREMPVTIRPGSAERVQVKF